MVRLKNIGVVFLLALSFVIAGCAESRKHSIVRENGYLKEHQPEQVAHYWDNVVWTVIDGTTLTMDISAPEHQGPLPCLVIFHGGSWTMHTAHIMEGMARYVTNRGYVVFNVNFRSLPDVKLEQIVDDCMGALLWVKEHATDYNGDPRRVAITGDSAGAHLAAMILTQADNPACKPSYQAKGKADLSVSCAALSYGVFDLVKIAEIEQSNIKRQMGTTYKQDPARYRLLSPALNIKPGMPPQFVMVGSLDGLLPQSVSYADALKAAGDPVELWVYKGQNHAFLNNFWEASGAKGYDRIIEFLDKTMKK
jgi:acetyl esterase